MSRFFVAVCRPYAIDNIVRRNDVSEYKPPLDDMAFVLEHIVDIEQIATLDGYEHADAETVRELLSEAGRFATEQIAPLNVVGDQQGVTIVDGAVITADGFAAAYRKFVDAGWNGVSFDPDYGGGGLPWVVGLAVQELLTASCMAFSVCPLLTQGAIELLAAHGNEQQKETFLARMISGEWTGTMNLTEPHAGSDVGALTTKATAHGDGTWRISGTKIFITYGDHDMAENIVHLVLARTPDAAPGTKGISCFIVPKFLVNDDGTLGDRNDAWAVSTEHKLGIHASPTCVMSYGDNGGAVGYLVGEEGAGMRCMFTMMNAARLSVGLQGLALAERAYQHARNYAMERVQGKPIGSDDPAAPIEGHVDVRRMLMTMKANIEAMRGVMYENAAAMDRAERAADADERASHDALAALYTPLSKGWGTDVGCEVTSTAMQVFGGVGFIEEGGAAQHFRDLRIAPIYEGTNGIQALDLVFRKLPMGGGAVVASLLESMSTLAQSMQGTPLDDIGDRLEAGVADARETAMYLGGQLATDPNAAAAGATPFMRLLGVVTGGWVLARMAVAAQSIVNNGTGDVEQAEDKIVTARFYAEQILPSTSGMVTPITRGDALMFAIPASRL
jgi:alkylation response protein AidB-like acyl-CoA dehydrogenase